jgi:hypothetical protein
MSFESELKKMLRILKKNQLKSNRKVLRRFHGKGYGLIKAKFNVVAIEHVENRIGIFKEEKSFDCIIRFSDGVEKVKADNKPGIRGMAIKLLNTGVLPIEFDEEGQTQDFLLTTRPFVWPGTIVLFRKSLDALFGNLFKKLLFGVRNIKNVLRLNKARIKPHNLLELDYGSATPHKFGEKTFVKWKAISRKPKTPKPKSLSKSVLSHNLKNDLKSSELGKEIKFDFGIQKQINSVTEPIDDASVVWETDFIKLAEIVIPMQEISAETLCNNAVELDFNPWHCNTLFEPVGDISLARRIIYREMAMYR